MLILHLSFSEFILSNENVDPKCCLTTFYIVINLNENVNEKHLGVHFYMMYERSSLHVLSRYSSCMEQIGCNKHDAENLLGE